MAEKIITNKKKLRRIRVIYICVALILLLCLGLFIFNVVTVEDSEQMEHIMSGQYRSNHDMAFAITDLHSNTALYEQTTDLVSEREDVNMCTRVNRFDVEVYANVKDFDKWGQMRWTIITQFLSVLLLLSVVVLTVIVLVSFYRNLKLGKVFPSKNIKLIRWIGILLIIMSLMADVGTYMERKMALDFLVGTGWEPEVKLSIHFTRILFGLVIVFLAEIFYVGYEMQEEQELTI